MSTLLARTLATSAIVASLGNAPLQCSRSPDPEVRREDSAGDALYALAEDFRARGDEEAARQTLRFLVARYPSNRHVPDAKRELEQAGGAPAHDEAAAVDGASGSSMPAVPTDGGR